MAKHVILVRYENTLGLLVSEKDRTEDEWRKLINEADAIKLQVDDEVWDENGRDLTVAQIQAAEEGLGKLICTLYPDISMVPFFEIAPEETYG